MRRLPSLRLRPNLFRFTALALAGALAPFSLADAPVSEAPPAADSAAKPASADDTAPTPVIASPHEYEYAFGIRYGYPVDNDFAFWELYGAWSPSGWYYDFNDDYRFRFGLTTGIGALRADNNDVALFYHAGPIVELVHRPTGLRIVARSEPSYMSRHSLGPTNLGEDFQFVSSIGIFWWPPSRAHWGFGVAIQHISNAGISNVNPGTEHVVFSVGFAF